MNRRARLVATLRGEPVDRPPVNHYELGGPDEGPGNSDPFNIYSDPSWAPPAKAGGSCSCRRRVPAPGGFRR